MFVDLLCPADWLALGAGALYALLIGLWNEFVWRARTWAEAQTSPLVFGLRAWGGWAFVANVLRAAASLGCLYGLLVSGIVLGAHVGDRPLAASLRRWLPATLGLAAWMALLWGWMLWRLSRRERTTQPNWPSYRIGWAELTIQALDREAGAAILRGALMPVIAGQWGIWLSPVITGILYWRDPARRQGHQNPEQRALAYLTWALDWVSAALYAISGSIWCALLARAICYALALVLYRWTLARPKPLQLPPA